jgi:hypothetical protein
MHKLIHKHNKYFTEGSFFFKLLRMLNLLEPDIPVISLSKVMVILVMFIMAYTTLRHPDQLAAIMGASFSLTIATANYGYRRHIQHRDRMYGTTPVIPAVPSGVVIPPQPIVDPTTGLAPDPD